jgi:hypothetical protein
VLRAGHAFEQATGFSARHPVLTPGEAAGTIDPKPWKPDTSGVEPAVRARAEAAAAAAGLRLPPHILEELVAVAPAALAMAGRLARGLPREAEVSSIFLPGRDVE